MEYADDGLIRNSFIFKQNLSNFLGDLLIRVTKAHQTNTLIPEKHVQIIKFFIYNCTDKYFLLNKDNKLVQSVMFGYQIHSR